MNEVQWDQFYQDVAKPLPVPVGTRIRLLSMTDDPLPIEPGTEGTVTGGNAAQMFVQWDNGRTLILLPATDKFEEIV